MEQFANEDNANAMEQRAFGSRYAEEMSDVPRKLESIETPLLIFAILFRSPKELNSTKRPQGFHWAADASSIQFGKKLKQLAWGRCASKRQLLQDSQPRQTVESQLGD